MKKKKYLRNCTKDETKAEYDCTMKFIASEMNCSIVLAEKSFYPENYPLCQTQYEFDSYIKIRKNIYNGSYDKQLQHCYLRRCSEESWVARFQAPITKEHNQQILELTELNKTEKMAMLTFWMPYTEVTCFLRYRWLDEFLCSYHIFFKYSKPHYKKFGILKKTCQSLLMLSSLISFHPM